MSHYTVAVFTKSKEQSIDELLAPYDENILVAPYVKKNKAQLIQGEKDELKDVFLDSYSEWKNDPKGYELKNRKWGYIDFLKSIPERMEWTDEQLYQEAIRFYDKKDLTPEGDLISTYNPKSKWDWWVIGGRWNGLLIPKVKKNPKKPQSCNAAYVTDIDFEAMKQRDEAKIEPYEEAMKTSHLKESYMRERFPTEDEYIKRSTAFSTYAAITPDGVWHAKGEMGWWGMSSETSAEDRAWDLGYQERFIKSALENNWYMTIVDCHI